MKTSDFIEKMEPAGRWGISISRRSGIPTMAHRIEIMASTTLPTLPATHGFSLEIGGSEARRQLRISVCVVVSVAIGIVSAAVAVGSRPLAVNRAVVSIVPGMTFHADSDAVGARAI